MSRLGTVTAERGEYLEKLTAGFERGLARIVGSARAAVLARLVDQLDIERGAIRRTAANQAVLRTISRRFSSELRNAGVSELIDGFVARFPEQFAYFDEVLRGISERLKNPLPRPKWTPQDRAYFSALQSNTISGLESALDITSAAAQQRVLFTAGALPLKELTGVLIERFGQAVPAAKTLAATSQVTFYRSITERGFEQIEAETPGMEYLYEYSGPNDKLTRPFCRHLLAGSKKFTREQIEAMDNGQLANAFVTGGGYNCRHEWRITGMRRRRR